MQFLVIGRDGDDAEALDRRMAARPAHLALAAQLKAAGTMLIGASLLDESGKMIGSTMVMDFPSRDELDAWIASDPYTGGDVWRSVEVRPCSVAPIFLPAS